MLKHQNKKDTLNTPLEKLDVKWNTMFFSVFIQWKIITTNLKHIVFC